MNLIYSLITLIVIGIFLVYKATKSLIKENRYNQKLK